MSLGCADRTALSAPTDHDEGSPDEGHCCPVTRRQRRRRGRARPVTGHRRPPASRTRDEGRAGTAGAQQGPQFIPARPSTRDASLQPPTPRH